ncbi:MAG: hypothetical protein RIB45_06620 [Marivibrio sp.]|uniref:hypothetical protein n=1 Tax=Marivibrio sp. TaxID=2039719 RepID=UPI0032EBF1BC
MRLQAHRQALSLWLGDGRRNVWFYRTEAHFFDQIAAPGFFAPVIERLSLGDLILVECPGYIEVDRPFGRRAVYTHRPGGGVLLVTAAPTDAAGTAEAPAARIAEGAAVEIAVLAEGLRRFPSPSAHAIPHQPICRACAGALSERPTPPARAV